jgi:hypothetical protein
MVDASLGFQVALSASVLINSFLNSRRQGLSKRTIEFYNCYLLYSIHIIGTDIKGQDMIDFLNSLGCTNNGKHAYFRAIRALYRWLYSLN